jgi:hypothetical protein
MAVEDLDDFLFAARRVGLLGLDQDILSEVGDFHVGTLAKGQ